MKKTSLTIAAALSLLAGTAAFAGELPTYEVNGFPASPVQVRLLGAANVQEQSAAPADVGTPHELGLLTPRKVRAATAAPVTTGLGH